MGLGKSWVINPIAGFAIATTALLSLNGGFLAQSTRKLKPTEADLALITPGPIDEWPPELEAAFQARAAQVLEYFANAESYGNTAGENEKRSYPYAMFDFFAGNRQRAIAFLSSEDAHAKKHAHTEGIDFYFSFTLKGQMRKFFLLGDFLPEDYRQRFLEGGRLWTRQDPLELPHPVYGFGNGTSEEWSVKRRGRWVDGRNTDNLRAMREVAIYLMAEATGNEDTRLRYRDYLQQFVWRLYHIGMGEWESAIYHGHTFAAYLNLYDFAQDPEVKVIANSALDYLSMAAALKYHQDSWSGPTKRDTPLSNRTFGASAARLFWLYFGDAPSVPRPEKDSIHVITSTYRPPIEAVAIANGEFVGPVAQLNTKPTYETWKPGNQEPIYWETMFYGQTFRMGSVVSASPAMDVTPFKLTAANAEGGADFFVVNPRGYGGQFKQGKPRHQQVSQYENLLIWLEYLPTDDARPLIWQLPQNAQIIEEGGYIFVEMSDTWLAIAPINLSNQQVVSFKPKLQTHYSTEQLFKFSSVQGLRGFALEVEEPGTYPNFAAFRAAVIEKSNMDLSAIATGKVNLRSSQNQTLAMQFNPQTDLPMVWQNGRQLDWSAHTDIFSGPLLSLDRTEGVLRSQDRVINASPTWLNYPN
ncbi:MAG: hypothetical protein AAGG02_08170 [Cyanobacteria bacterium P01_H01_bin.15]